MGPDICLFSLNSQRWEEISKVETKHGGNEPWPGLLSTPLSCHFHSLVFLSSQSDEGMLEAEPQPGAPGVTLSGCTPDHLAVLLPLVTAPAAMAQPALQRSSVTRLCSHLPVDLPVTVLEWERCIAAGQCVPWALQLLEAFPEDPAIVERAFFLLRRVCCVSEDRGPLLAAVPHIATALKLHGALSLVVASCLACLTNIAKVGENKVGSCHWEAVGTLERTKADPIPWEAMPFVSPCSLAAPRQVVGAGCTQLVFF
jgi:hypothetical protein